MKPEQTLSEKLDTVANLAFKLAGQTDSNSKYFDPVEAKTTMALLFNLVGDMDFEDLPEVPEHGNENDSLEDIRQEQLQSNVYDFLDPIEN